MPLAVACIRVPVAQVAGGRGRRGAAIGCDVTVEAEVTAMVTRGQVEWRLPVEDHVEGLGYRLEPFAADPEVLGSSSRERRHRQGFRGRRRLGRDRLASV